MNKTLQSLRGLPLLMLADGRMFLKQPGAIDMSGTIVRLIFSSWRVCGATYLAAGFVVKV